LDVGKIGGDSGGTGTKEQRHSKIGILVSGDVLRTACGKKNLKKKGQPWVFNPVRSRTGLGKVFFCFVFLDRRTNGWTNV